MIQKYQILATQNYNDNNTKLYDNNTNYNDNNKKL